MGKGPFFIAGQVSNASKLLDEELEKWRNRTRVSGWEDGGLKPSSYTLFSRMFSGHPGEKPR